MRVKTGIGLRNRHKKVLKATKGFRMTKNRLYHVAHEALMHAGQYAYAHRQRRASQMRELWVLRVAAAARINGMTYSKFVGAMKKAKIDLDRKVLSDIAFNNPEVFAQIVKAL
jgi:large subunit ribosomal protein L20